MDIVPSLSTAAGWVAQSFSTDSLTDPEFLLPAAFVALFAVLALGLLYRGVTNLVESVDVWTGEPIDAGDFHVESGEVEVEGTAEAVDGTVAAPYSDTSALAYTYRKERREHTTDADGNTQTKWRTVDSGRNAVPFAVADDTGSVVVDPGDATLSLDSERAGGSGRTRLYEGRLEPGDTVYAHGRKESAADAGSMVADEREYVGGGDDLTVSDTTETWTAVRFGAKGIGQLVVGAVILGVIAVFAANAFGVPLPVDPATLLP